MRYFMDPSYIITLDLRLELPSHKSKRYRVAYGLFRPVDYFQSFPSAEA
jgi:hypothetical protein